MFCHTVDNVNNFKNNFLLKAIFIEVYIIDSIFYDFNTPEEAKKLSNCPAASRRHWARLLFTKYSNSTPIQLIDEDFNNQYGQIVKEHFPTGAMLSILDNNESETLLIIQVYHIKNQYK